MKCSGLHLLNAIALLINKLGECFDKKQAYNSKTIDMRVKHWMF